MPWKNPADARAAADTVAARVGTYVDTQRPHPLGRRLNYELIADVALELDPAVFRNWGGRVNGQWARREHAFYERLSKLLDPAVYSLVASAMFDAHTRHAFSSSDGEFCGQYERCRQPVR
jgi:hypothetical protein